MNVGFVGAVALGAALFGTPSDAQACSVDDCYGSAGFLEFSAGHATVAPDGVLVFRARRGISDAVSHEETLEYITVVVEDGQGTALDGALEVSGDAFVWRPSAELIAGSELSVSVSIDNAAIAKFEGCPFEDAEFTMAVGDASAPALALPELAFSTAYQFYPSIELDAYVCCDDAYPIEEVGGCGGEPPYFSEGYCVAGRGTGYAQARFEAATLGEAEAATVRVELLADGEVVASALGVDFAESGISRNLDHAFDAELRVVSLLDGSEVVSDASLADGAQPEALGEIEPDISAELEENCESPAYTCDAYPPEAPEPYGWDPDACEPVDDDSGETDDPSEGGTSETEGDSMSGSDTDGDTDAGDTDGGADTDAAGCGCSAGSTTPWSGGLLLFAVAGLVRRRRNA